MKLEKIIAIADAAYPDGLVGQAFKKGTALSKRHGSSAIDYLSGVPGVGDGLAEFIAHELAETFDPKASSLEQLEEAACVMHNARRELVDVAEALELKYNEARAKATTQRRSKSQ